MRWEFLALFLLELAFIAIIGLMYAGAVIFALWMTDLIEKALYKIVNKIKNSIDI